MYSPFSMQLKVYSPFEFVIVSCFTSFAKFNSFIIKHYKVIFAIFLILLVPAYLANKKVDVYWQIMMNIDIITELFIKHIQQWKRLKENQ